MGQYPGDSLGSSVAGAGDVDGDGFDDLLLGAPHYRDGVWSAAAAYVVRGRASPAWMSLSAADALFTGEAAVDYAGCQAERDRTLAGTAVVGLTGGNSPRGLRSRDGEP